MEDRTISDAYGAGKAGCDVRGGADLNGQGTGVQSSEGLH